MLTKTQLRNLVKKDGLDKVTRAKYEYIAVKKLMVILDDLQDADIILSKVPKNKLQKYLKDEHVETLLRISTSLMRKLDFNKVRSIDDETLFVYIEDESHHLQRAEPSENDIKRAKMLHEDLYNLEAFVDPELLKRGAEIPGYEPPKSYPGGIHDASEEQERFREEERIAKRIKELLSDGLKDIDQIGKIAKDVGSDPDRVLAFVYRIQETERETEKRKHAIATLERDSAAIQKIKELWAEGWFNKTAIAVAIGYPRGAVITVTEKMMVKGEIPKDLILSTEVDSFPTPSEIDLRKHEEIARAMQPFMSRRDEPK